MGLRQIKFRQFDVVNSRMRALHTLALPGAAGAMQFTGLTDHEGQEIYEGDVFECVGGTGERMMQGDVYFDDGCFRIRYGYQNPGPNEREGYFLSSIICGDVAHKITVIGNIYENPDLVLGPPTEDKD